MADENLIITPEQSRAGRALLNWSQDELAQRASISQSTVRDFEKGRRVPSPNNLKAIWQALRDAGVALVDDGFGGGAGVRFAEASEEAAKRAEMWRIQRRIYREMSHLKESEEALRYYALAPAPSNSIASDFARKVKYSRDDIARHQRAIADCVNELHDLVGYIPHDIEKELQNIYEFHAARERKIEGTDVRDVRLVDLEHYKDLRERLLNENAAGGSTAAPSLDVVRKMIFDHYDDTDGADEKSPRPPEGERGE